MKGDPDALQRLYGAPEVGAHDRSTSETEPAKAVPLQASEVKVNTAQSQGGSVNAAGSNSASEFSRDSVEQRIVSPETQDANLAGVAENSGVLISSSIEEGLKAGEFEPVTITQYLTKDLYKTFTNVHYNTIPVTLTQFMKKTKVLPTVQVRESLLKT